MGKGTRELKNHYGPTREDRETPRPVYTEGMDLAAVEQLSREVLILEKLKSELLERNSRLECWHAQHPHTSTSQSGCSKSPRDTFNRANAGASGKLRQSLYLPANANNGGGPTMVVQPRP